MDVLLSRMSDISPYHNGQDGDHQSNPVYQSIESAESSPNLHDQRGRYHWYQSQTGYPNGQMSKIQESVGLIPRIDMSNRPQESSPSKGRFRKKHEDPPNNGSQDWDQMYDMQTSGQTTCLLIPKTKKSLGMYTKKN